MIFEVVVDTSNAIAQLNQFRNQLNGMGGAGAQANSATTALQNNLQRVGAAATGSAGALGNATQAANNNTAAVGRAAAANNAAGVSARSHAAGMSQLGAQFQDVAVQAQMGTDPLRILAMQGGQVASAMSLMQGAAGRVGTFMAGPWGVAIMVGVSVLGSLIMQLWNAEEASEELRSTTDHLGAAQGALGKMFDFSTGRIKNNTQALRDNVYWQMLQMQTAARVAKAEGAKYLAESSLGPTGKLSRAWEGAVDYALGGNAYDTDQKIKARDSRGKNLAAMGDVVADGRLSLEDAGKAILEARKKGILKSDKEQQEALTYMSHRFDERNALAAAKDIQSGLDGNMPEWMRKSGGSKRTRSGGNSANELSKLAQLGETAAERIKRINEAFDEQPKLVDRVNQATRELDKIIGEVSEKKPPNFEKLIEDAKKAKIVVNDALTKPFRDMIEASERQQKIGSLILAGREDEGTALEKIYALQDKVGEVTREQREAILANVKAEKELNEVLAKRDNIIGAYSSAIGDIRSQLESLLSGNFDGNPLKALRDTFKNLNGKLMTEKLFGPMLRDLETYVKEKTGIQSSVDIMKEGTIDAGKAASTLATSMKDAAAVITKAAETIAGISSGTTAATSQSVASIGAGLMDSLRSGAARVGKTFADSNAPVDPVYGEIVVSGSRPVARPTETSTSTPERVVGTIKIEDFADKAARGITQPITDQLSELLGDKFGQMLGGVMSGALAGYLKAGTPGAVIGGLQSLTKGIKGLEGVTKHLGVAMEGAEYGTKVAAMGKMVWSKFSTTGSQIGGAIGALSGIPGGKLIGSIIGGTIGGALKKAKKASQGFEFDESGKLVLGDLSGNSKKFKDAASNAGDGVISGLYSLAEKLGANLTNVSMASIGIRDGKWRVDADGSGDTKTKKGAIDFGKDGEAAAISFVIKDAIRKGVLTGMSEFSNRIVKTGEDAMIDLAAKYETMLNELAEIKNPLAYAFDKLVSQTKDMTTAMKGAGATAEDLAKVQEYARLKADKLYEDGTSGFTDFRKALDGDGSGVTKLNQLLGKQSELDAMRATIAGGGTVDQEKFTTLGQDIFALARDVYGTATQEFQAIRGDLIGVTDGLLTNARAEYEKATAEAAKATAQNTALAADYLAQIAANTSGGGGGGGVSNTSGLYNSNINIMDTRFTVNGNSYRPSSIL